MKCLVLILLLTSCSVTKYTNDCFFVVDYLILETEEDADNAIDGFFQLGIETEYEVAEYNDKWQFVIEIQDLTLLDYEVDGYRVFPEWYKNKVIRFCLE